MTSTTTIIRITQNKNPTPGPGSYNIPSDFGNTAPKYSIKNKPKERETTIGIPYQNLPSYIGTGKKYSLSSRVEIRQIIENPGPNYFPPEFGTNAPKCQFHIKPNYNQKSLTQIPGPGAYVIQKDFGSDGKKISIKNKNFIREEGEISGPGVGNLLPDYSKILKNPPQTSIGNRYYPKKDEKVLSPGPSDYQISRELNNKSSAFHIKSNDNNKIPNTPGPGKYDQPTFFSKSAPKFTIRSKHETKKDIIDPPIEKVPDLFGKVPPVYMHARTTSRELPQTLVGPDYLPPKFGSNAPKWSFKGRNEIKSSNQTSIPGPGAYDNNSTIMLTSRSYSIKNKTNFKENLSEGPGPANYSPNYNIILKKSPEPSIKNKFSEHLDLNSMGYVNLGTTLNGPKFTIGSKEKIDVTSGLN